MSSRFRFGSFTLDVRTRLLSNGGAPVALGPTVIETLAVLVESAGELVTKDELMQRVWPDRFVEEANVTQNVYRLRRVLSAAGLTGAIETMACRGYRFVAKVEPISDAAAPEIAPIPALPSASRRRPWAFAALAAVLSISFLAAGIARPRPVPAFARLSPESQRIYRLGRYHLNLRSDLAHIAKSLSSFNDVVQRDPANPLGYAGRADAYLATFDMACDATVTACRSIVALATENARRAVAADPRSAEAHTSLAMTINEFTHQDGRADAEFERAIQLDPSYALAHHWYGNSLLVRGLFARAKMQHVTALALEPTSPSTYAWLADDAFFSRQYRDAIAYARESLAIYPRRHPTRVLLGLAYERVGDERAAIASFDQLPRVERNALVAGLHARAGRRAEALATLRTIGRREALASESAFPIALAWLALGEKSRAYAFMRATSPANRVERNFVAFDPRLDSVRSDPRFRRWTVPD